MAGFDLMLQKVRIRTSEIGHVKVGIFLRCKWSRSRSCSHQRRSKIGSRLKHHVSAVSRFGKGFKAAHQGVIVNVVVGIWVENWSLLNCVGGVDERWWFVQRVPEASL